MSSDACTQVSAEVKARTQEAPHCGPIALISTQMFLFQVELEKA